MTHLGLAARLIAPALGAAALGCLHQLTLDPSSLWWQDQLGGPVPLSIPAPQAGGQGPAAGTGPRLACHDLVDEVIIPLTTAVAGLAPVSPRVLWGNVASAGNSAAAQIAAQRPALAPAAWAAARALASHPRLSTERTPPGPAFRRSSCCLIYQLAPGPARAICGDCVLTPP